MAKHYSELIQSAIENVTGALGLTTKKGLLKFKTDGATPNRPYIDDGTDFNQIMMEKYLPEARRTTKVALDGSGDGIEVTGVLPYTNGGTGLSTLAGQSGLFIQVNATENGFTFAAAGASLNNFAYCFIPAGQTVIIPENQVMYLIDKTIDVEGTLDIEGAFESIVL